MKIKIIKLFFVLFLLLSFTETYSDEQFGKYTIIYFKDSLNTEIRPGNPELIAASEKGQNMIAISDKGLEYHYFRSVDFGKTWELFHTDEVIWEGGNKIAPPDLRCIDMPSKDLIVLGSHNGKLKISRDFGESWEWIETEYSKYWFRDIKMYDNELGFALLRYDFYPDQYFRPYGKLLKTTDGWQSWEEVDLPDTLLITKIYDNIHIFDEDHFLFYQVFDGENKDGIGLFTTEDGGKTWNVEINQHLACVGYKSQKEIYSMKSEIVIYDSVNYKHRYISVFQRSFDWGKTWEVMQANRYDTLTNSYASDYQIKFDGDDGVITKYPYIRYLTKDGGKTWYKEFDYEYEHRHKYKGMMDCEIVDPDFIAYAATRTLVIYDNRSTGVESEDNTFSLSTFPNPFSETTTISYNLPQADRVAITIFDALGNEIAVPVNEYVPAGEHKAQFNGTHLQSGIYYYSIRIGSGTRTGKMILVK